MASFVETCFTPKKDIPRRAYFSAMTVITVPVLVAWCIATYGGWANPDFLPAPHAPFVAGWEMLQDGSLLKHAWASVSVIFTGFILASVIAVPLGIFMGSFKIVEGAVEPIVNFVRYLPVSALIPLLILWIGIGFEEKVAVIFLGTFFQQLVLIADVSKGVSNDLLDTSYTLGASRWTVVSKILIPASMPGVIDTLRVTMGWAWTYLVVAELVAASSGLGYMILNASRGLYTDVIFLGILVIGLLGLITDQVIKHLRQTLMPWASNP